MLKYIQRGTGDSRPLGDLPPWLSTLLRSRGIDSPEKAEKFLHPSLGDLHDPFLMQGMDKAVRILRRALAEKQSILIYGDYDVDGMCATSILLETLRELGGQVDFYIPSRHGEGYGLNCDAVREIAATHQLLLTVDCGVTNHEEVLLAQSLGMTVIVSDHHQLAETPSPADVVLNPLLGDYPFRRLCGAGVALKLCQALQGMEGARSRIELAALATVADIVPLTDENRIIVRYGLDAMAVTDRPGLKALLEVSGVTPPVNAGQVGFRLAPRLNAGGRLEEAAQGVLLLTTRDEAEAKRIAAHLEEQNQLRQAMEQEITRQAIAAIPETVDFYKDQAIILMGEGWNNGVIGLAAGRICEKYHFPTIVLSSDGEKAVGSCRSIPGVDIHRMLTGCKDLFQRFGGHEQAAGLTMDPALVPELRRRLSLQITEKCDLSRFVPEKEYDLQLPLAQVDLDLVDRLELMQPTGFGNPSPVFLTRDVSLQQARRVGAGGAHLKLSVLDGETMRDGIAFQLGSEADRGLTRVDVLFTPDRNEWNGQVRPQLMVKALTPSADASPIPADPTNFGALLQELTHLAENLDEIPQQALPGETRAAVRSLLKTGRGVLLVAHTAETAAGWLQEVGGQVDVCMGAVEDERAFNTLLCAMEPEKLRDVWHHVVLLEGDQLPGEAAWLREKCPRAVLHACKPASALKKRLGALAMADGPLREVYKAVRRGGVMSAARLAEASGCTYEQVMTALTAFSQVKLAAFTPEPFTLRLDPSPAKCAMSDSPLIAYLRRTDHA